MTWLKMLAAMIKGCHLSGTTRQRASFKFEPEGLRKRRASEACNGATSASTFSYTPIQHSPIALVRHE
jgi:hypothetical protein